MKKLLIPLLAILLVAAVSPLPANAEWGHGGGGRGGFGERHEFHGRGGCFGCAFAGGLVLGGILGGVLAAPYYAPPPVVYEAPPPPTCYTRPGYWSQVPYTSYGGFTTYQNVWVPPQTVCR